MRITGKKIIALTLTLAMLLSCMVFSFSGSAAVTKLWENHFENGSTTNWASSYGADNANSHFNSGRVIEASNFKNYAVPKTTDNNTYMALGFGSDLAQQRISGFIVLHEGTTNTATANVGTYGHAGKYRYSSLAQGSFQPDSGKYAIKLDYNAASIADGGQIDLYVAFTAALWSDDRTKSYLDDSVQSVYEKVVTLTPDNEGDGWQSLVHYVDLTVPSDQYWYMHIFARTDDAYTSLNGSEVWVDNIEVSSYADESDFPSISVYYGDTLLDESHSMAGMPYTMPTLTGLPTNAHVTYYSDAALTQEIDIPTVYPAESMNIYVKAEKYLANDPWSFETEADGTDITTIDTYGTGVITNDYAHSGNQSLMLDCSLGNGGETTALVPQFMLKNGSDEYSRVEIGKEYLISYWVMVPDDSKYEFQNNMFLVADPSKTGSYHFSGSIYNTKHRVFRNNGSSYVTVPADGKWHQIVNKLDSSMIGNLYNGSQCGYGLVTVGLANIAPQEGLTVYIDDMELICVDDLVTGGSATHNDREQYLFDGTGAQGKTHLHTHSTSNDGVYTSVRLGATYTAGDANGNTIVLGGVANTLTERGIVVGTAGMTLNAAGAQGTDYKWLSSKTSGFNNAWEIADNQFTYTLRLANIGETPALSGTKYVYRSYYKVSIPHYTESGASSVATGTNTSTTFTVYGNESNEMSFLDIYNACSANGTDGASWFE